MGIDGEVNKLLIEINRTGQHDREMNKLLIEINRTGQQRQSY